MKDYFIALTLSCPAMKNTHLFRIAFVLVALVSSAPLVAEGAEGTKLSELFKTVEIQDKPHLAIPMREVLGFSLLNSRQFKESQNQAKNAYFRWQSQTAPADIRFTSSVTQQKTNLAFASSVGDFLALSQTNSQIVSTGLTHKTNLGFTYGLNYSQTTSQSFSSSIVNAGDPASAWTSSTSPYSKGALTADFNVSLLKNFGTIGQLEEEKEQIRFEQSKTQLQATQNAIIQQIGGIYWDLVEVHDNLHSMQMAKDSAQQFYEESKLRNELGELSTTELKQSQLQLAVAEQNLLNEEQRKSGIEDQIKAALQLKELNELYTPTEKMEIKEHTPFSKKLLNRAFAADTTLQTLKQSLALAGFEQLTTKNKYQSSLDLSLQYKLNGYGDQPQSAVSHLQDPNTQGYVLSLTWDVPLFDYRGDQQIHQANMDQNNLKLRIEDQKDLIKLQLQALLRNLDFGAKSIAMAEISIQLNQELVDRELESFRLGHSTSYRVSQVQDDLSLAKLQATQAKTRYEKAYLSFLIMTGEAANYYNLKLDSRSNNEQNPLK